MKVSVIKQIIQNLDDNAEIYCGYSDDNELEFDLFTEQDLIDRANNQAGIEDVEPITDVDTGTEDVEPITDVDTAIQYLAENDTEYHIMQ